MFQTYWVVAKKIAMNSRAQNWSSTKYNFLCQHVFCIHINDNPVTITRDYGLACYKTFDNAQQTCVAAYEEIIFTLTIMQFSYNHVAP